MQDRSQTPAFRAAYLAARLARHYPDATPHRIAQVVTAMQAAAPHRIAQVVTAMQAAARAALAWETRRCNVPMTEAQKEAGTARIERLRLTTQITLEQLCTPGGAVEPAAVALGGDPRGPCGRLHIPGQRGDGWGDGFAIY